MNLHFNHPDELTPAVKAACGMLADAGVPLGAQTVLLKGVNDDPDIMKRLVHQLLLARVKPYYLVPSGPDQGHQPFPDDDRNGPEHHQSAAGPHERDGRPTFRHRCAGRRRQNPPASRRLSRAYG